MGCGIFPFSWLAESGPSSARMQGEGSLRGLDTSQRLRIELRLGFCISLRISLLIRFSTGTVRECYSYQIQILGKRRTKSIDFILHPNLFFALLFFAAWPLLPNYTSQRPALFSCARLSCGCCSSGFTRSFFSSLSNSKIGVQRRRHHCQFVASFTRQLLSAPLSLEYPPRQAS
jgi:hypothetical protein